MPLKSSPTKSGTSCQLYNDCSKLPLERFIDALIDEDLQQLVISGTPTDEQLREAWDKLYVEYLELSQSGSYNETFEVMKEIDDLRSKICIVSNIITHLQVGYNKELIDILNSMALRCNIIESDKGEVLISKLNQIVARMKKWFPRLSMRQKDLERLRQENTRKIDRAYFDDCLDAMSANAGYAIEASKITVSRFCRSLVRMREQVEKEQLKQLKLSY